MNQFKIGDIVQWTSQAGGGVTTKTGEVVLVIPPDTPPYGQLYAFQRQHPYGTFKNMTGGGLARDHESYVVKVIPGPRAKARLYWPRVQHLVAQQ